MAEREPFDRLKALSLSTGKLADPRLPPVRNSRFPVPLVLGPAGHRYESDRAADLLPIALGGARYHFELLEIVAHRDDEAPADFELFEQRRRNFFRRGRHHDGIERRRLRPAAITVAEAEVDVSVAEAGQIDLRRRASSGMISIV